MFEKFKRDRQKGIIPAILAVIVALASIALILLVGALIFWIHHLVAGLIGGGNQPGGGPNIGCHLEGSEISKATSSQNKTFSLTAFYHPVPGQTKYELGSYEAELRMEGGGSSASGIKLEKGAIAAPPSYPFGTVIDIAGFGRGVVIDRGCAIQEAGAPSKCPSLANPVTKYDHLDLFMGEGDQGRMAMDQWNGKEAQGTVYFFNFINNGNVKDYVRVVCQNAYGSGSTGFNNVPYFSQRDPRWGSNSYGCGTTIADAGCGVTSAAMILKFYGKNVDPAIMASLSLANGTRPCGGGTAPNFFHDVAAPNYSLKEQDVTFNEAMQAIQQGKPVIALMNDHFFSSGGHYIVLTGIDSSGMVMINDPYPKRGCEPVATVQCGRVPKATQNQVQENWNGGYLITP